MAHGVNGDILMLLPDVISFRDRGSTNVSACMC
jgi:hypothetical protein